MISRDASCQVLSRPLLISKRQQDTLALDGMVGDLNLMTSQDFDNYCVNGTFYLARGHPSSSTRWPQGDELCHEYSTCYKGTQLQNAKVW